jgi:hypothetical protein
VKGIRKWKRSEKRFGGVKLISMRWIGTAVDTRRVSQAKISNFLCSSGQINGDPFYYTRQIKK